MPASQFKIQTKRRITGGFLLLMYVFALMTQVVAATTIHPAVPSTCSSEMTQEHHSAMIQSTVQMDAAESDDCIDAESGCWQCSYCTTLVGTIERNSLLYTELSHFSLLEAATPFSTRLDRPPKTLLI
ncbi:MAG: hypothetical protein IBX50_09970 [Marinospirillum sp.]|uniref:hypothetical protein n=1 Tax=Marinospirillum sp. TaxID=2183934 RepID=UPI0019FF43D3|nr:hypothetical protein [Marinospirillum sp.]MBE0507029.1 hypothetical protein [Marinospirillum sp.]